MIKLLLKFTSDSTYNPLLEDFVHAGEFNFTNTDSKSVRYRDAQLWSYLPALSWFVLSIVKYWSRLSRLPALTLGQRIFKHSLLESLYCVHVTTNLHVMNTIIIEEKLLGFWQSIGGTDDWWHGWQLMTYIETSQCLLLHQIVGAILHLQSGTEEIWTEP